VEGVGTLDLDRFDLFRLDLDVLALRHLIPAALVALIHDLARHLIHHQLAQAMTGLTIDLVKMGLLGQAGGRIERNWAGDKRELEITLPIRAASSGHSKLQWYWPKNPSCRYEFHNRPF